MAPCALCCNHKHMRCVGVTSSKELLLAAPQSGPLTRLPRADARRDILIVITNELQVGVVFFVHPGEARFRRALGGSAAQRDTERLVQYRQDEWGTYHFTPLSMETFGRLGKPMMRLLSNIWGLAVLHGDRLFTKEQFVSRVLGELSVSFCQTNARRENVVSCFFINPGGVCLKHGQSHPNGEVSDWD
jgi:hypothetical protein